MIECNLMSLAYFPILYLVGTGNCRFVRVASVIIHLPQSKYKQTPIKDLMVIVVHNWCLFWFFFLFLFMLIYQYDHQIFNWCLFVLWMWQCIMTDVIRTQLQLLVPTRYKIGEEVDGIKLHSISNYSSFLYIHEFRWILDALFCWLENTFIGPYIKACSQRESRWCTKRRWIGVFCTTDSFSIKTN